MSSPKKIYLILSVVLAVIVLVYLSLYFLGKPNIEKIMPGSSIYFIDQLSESIYVYSDYSFYNMARKSISLMDERVDEAKEYSLESGEAYYEDFEKSLSKNISRSQKLCSKVEDVEERDSCYSELFGKILSVSEILFDMKIYDQEKLDILLHSAADTFNNISEEGKESTAKANQDKINRLSDASSELGDTTDSYTDDDGDENDGDNDDDGRDVVQREFDSIDEIDKGLANQAVAGAVEGVSYKVATINCYKKEGIFSAVVNFSEEDNDEVLTIIFGNKNQEYQQIAVFDSDSVVQDVYDTLSINKYITWNNFVTLTKKGEASFVEMSNLNNINYY